MIATFIEDLLAAAALDAWNRVGAAATARGDNIGGIMRITDPVEDAAVRAGLWVAFDTGARDVRRRMKSDPFGRRPS